jgi:hypothetical protein
MNARGVCVTRPHLCLARKPRALAWNGWASSSRLPAPAIAVLVVAELEALAVRRLDPKDLCPGLRHCLSMTWIDRRIPHLDHCNRQAFVVH